MTDLLDRLTRYVRSFGDVREADCPSPASALFLMRLAKTSAEAAARIQELEGHVEQLVELLDIIKEHWIDYDHIYSIAVHEALASINQDGGKP